MRDYATILKRLRQYSENCVAYKLDADFANAVTDAADAIEELLAELTTIRKQLPRWISVENEPPETGKPIFVVDNRGNVANAILSSNYVVGDEGGYGYIGRITHWCKSLPLPAPPKGVE